MMIRVIQQEQNNGKALEIRLEQAGEKYYVVLAGMTFNLRTGCASGLCEATGEDEYMSIENETYREYPFNNYQDARSAFETFKQGVIR